MNINIPKPPEQGNKTDAQYLQELKAWSFKLYDALRHLAEKGGNTK